MKVRDGRLVSFASHFFWKICLTLLSSLDVRCLFICLSIQVLLMAKENDLFAVDYLPSVLFVFIHYFLFTLSYAEMLPWETGLILVLVVLLIIYVRQVQLTG